MNARDGEIGELGSHEMVIVRRRRNVGRALALFLAGIIGLFLLAVAALWVARKPIANNMLAREMARRGVPATYHLDRVGLRTQRISNLVIGNPAHPDLTAKVAQVEMRILLSGKVEVYRVVARGVRLRGQLIDGRVSFGALDKLLPTPSGSKTPFKFPDVAVDIADSTIALRTPFGPLGFAVAGQGNLTGGFKGRLAAASPRLAPGKCALEAMRASMVVSIEARRPHATGPLTAASFACPQSRISVAAPRIEVDSDFSEAFGTFDGKGRLTTPALIAGTNGLANLIANVSFKGSPTSVGGTIDLAAQKARLASIFADRTQIEGRYHLGAAKGDLALVANYDATNASLAPSMLDAVTRPLAGAAKTPIGPITTAIAAALTRTAGGFDAKGALRLVNFPGGGAVRIETADARAPSGARIRVAGRDGVTFYWPSGRIRVDSQIATEGGGLPTSRIDLRQPRNGAPMSGEVRFAPYAANGARLALDPVRFAAQRDGSTLIRTTALLDGPFSGGRVTGLRVPVVGRLGGPLGFSFGNACLDTSFQSLELGAMKLGAARVPLCPTGSALVSQRPGGPLQLGAVTQQLRLAGTLGSSPVQIAADRARLWGIDRFDATSVGMRLGRADSPVVIEARQLDGRIGRDIRGTFSGGAGTIGKIPLAMSQADGRFTFAKALTVDGALTVSDRSDKIKFYPLAARGVHFVLAGDRITTTGALHNPASGALVTNVSILHQLASGRGHADLDVPGLRFALNGLQPDAITPLTEGVIALVDGTIAGQGRINWNGTRVTSTGDFSTAGTDLAAPFGPITGLAGTIHFTDLLALETAPGQSVTLATVNPGIPVENGTLRYQLLPGQLVKIERGEWPFMGGRLILRETILNLGRPTAKRLTFEVVGLDAHTLVESFGFKEISASGTFDGVLPMIFDESGGRIVGGRLDSRAPGGSLSYIGVVSKANLGLFGGIVFNALRDLRFHSMIVRLDGDLAGEFATRLTVDEVALGNNKTQRIVRGLLKKLPFKFNVSIKGPFRALIGTAKSFTDPRNTIHDALPGPLANLPDAAVTIRKVESQDQTQTPVKDQVTMTRKPEQ
ncbi:MAG: YdbH domain-containing protein [Sphingomicrobium sp.]